MSITLYQLGHDFIVVVVVIIVVVVIDIILVMEDYGLEVLAKTPGLCKDPKLRNLKFDFFFEKFLTDRPTDRPTK